MIRPDRNVTVMALVGAALVVVLIVVEAAGIELSAPLVALAVSLIKDLTAYSIGPNTDRGVDDPHGDV